MKNKKQKQLELKLKNTSAKAKVRFPSIYNKLIHHITLRYEFISRKFFKLQYMPIYIACLILFIMSIISTTIVIYDTDEHITSYKKMQQLFLNANYDLNKIRRGQADVPRIFIKSLPSDFNMIESTKEKKDLFIKFLLPLVLKKNEELKATRDEFIRVVNKNLSEKETLTIAEVEFLNNIYIEYKTDNQSIQEILTKLDEMSVAQAIGQAVQETGWGESRFLIQGNAIFAEWTWGGEGMLPRSRKEGLNHRIKTFPTLYDSVISYANNLNKTRYYTGFRRLRAELRTKNKPLDGGYLMGSMIYYSTEKNKYINDVKRIIRDNSLNDFNTVKLAPLEPIEKVEE